MGILNPGYRGKPFLSPFGRNVRGIVRIEGRAPSAEGLVVSVRLRPQQRGSRELVGSVEEVLGRLDDPSVDSKIVLHRFDLPPRFPAEVEREAQSIPDLIPAVEHKRRRDLRQVPFVTIDGEDARDHDDAVALDGPDTVWVAIADVGHYVKTDSILDREAAARGNSFYFPDRVLPMLPERLSNDLCSLRPDRERLVLAARLTVDRAGRLKKTELCEGIIRSRARLTYEGVDEALRRKPTPELTAMRKLSERLFSARMEDGGIDFELAESKVVLDAAGHVTAMARRERTPSQRIVEEFMLLANKGVARLLGQAGGPLVYRVHDQPDEKKLSDFFLLLREHGHRVTSRDLPALLKQFQGSTNGKIYSYLALRSMPQASYSPANIGHYGLGFPDYVHFTSPIRRYADLIVHRAVRRFLKGDPPSEKGLFSKAFGTLENISLHISARERIQMKAEREIRLLKGIRFLQERVGGTYTGVIVGVITAGFFVELDDHAVEGFVPARTLPNDRYEFRERDLSLRGRRGRVFRVGDPVGVRVASVSLPGFTIDFALAGDPLPARPA